jgi:hypothetical protein
VRLAAIKKKYDPHNFFHVNQNIKRSLIPVVRPGGHRVKFAAAPAACGGM